MPVTMAMWEFQSRYKPVKPRYVAVPVDISVRHPCCDHAQMSKHVNTDLRVPSSEVVAGQVKQWGIDSSKCDSGGTPNWIRLS